MDYKRTFLHFGTYLSSSLVYAFVYGSLVSYVWKTLAVVPKIKKKRTNENDEEKSILTKIIQEQVEEQVQCYFSRAVSASTNKSIEITIAPNPHQRRILVTGGAGFVGSHLVDKLMHQGHHVIVVDNLFTGRRCNIQHWEGHPHFTFIIHDVVEPLFVEVDQIYHLACPASPPHYQYNPIKTIKTSVLGTLNMLGLAKRVQARILLTSTSEIYGDPLIHPQDETYWGNVNPIGPRSCYDEGKRVAETMMYAYNKQHDLDIRVARIFNTYGPRMHPKDGRVVSNFIIQALQNQPITIYGDGSQTRSFQYVDDLVNGLLLLMESSHTSPINLGNPEEFQVINLAEIIKEKTHSHSNIKYLPATIDDPMKRKPDIKSATRILKWSPNISLSDGLEKTIEYFLCELVLVGDDIVPTGQDPSKPNSYLLNSL